MKKYIIILVSLLAYACTDEQVTLPAPQISEVEIGSNNSKVAYPGSELHLEAQILAEGIIDKVVVLIHKEGGWQYTKDFSQELGGQKNGEIHTHLEVPEDAALGNYTLTITVSDKEGKRKEYKSTLELKVKG
jgi:hypothetical protein